jgi:hypothetical protein
MHLKNWLSRLGLIACLALSLVFVLPQTAFAFIPPKCQVVQEEIKNKIAERADLQEQLSEAAPGKKPSIAKEIKKIDAEIAAKQSNFDKCMIDEGGLPDLLSTLKKGEFTLTINNPNIPEPIIANISAILRFNKFDHKTVTVLQLNPNPLSLEANTPFGKNTANVTLNFGNGKFDPVSKNLELDISFNVDNSIIIAGDSQLAAKVSTKLGSPLSNTGAIELKGSGQFTGGFLNNSTAALGIKGQISPLP